MGHRGFAASALAKITDHEKIAKYLLFTLTIAIIFDILWFLFGGYKEVFSLYLPRLLELGLYVCGIIVKLALFASCKKSMNEVGIFSIFNPSVRTMPHHLSPSRRQGGNMGSAGNQALILT